MAKNTRRKTPKKKRKKKEKKSYLKFRRELEFYMLKNQKVKNTDIDPRRMTFLLNC
jgi:hypothetical protein